MPSRKRDATPNLTLYNLRDAQSETQEQTAAALNALAAARGENTAITGNHVSRWERGVVHPSRLHTQLLAEHFGVTPAELGLTRQRIAPAGHIANIIGALRDTIMLPNTDQLKADPRVIESQQEWLHVRRKMSTHRLRLADIAAQLYAPEVRSGTSGMLIHPEWNPPTPIDLSQIRLTFTPGVRTAQVDGTEEFASAVRPLRTPTERYKRYSHAIRDVARPKLFENRPSWRLLHAQVSDTGGELSFGDMSYFEAMDTCEAVAHETAVHHLINTGDEADAPSWRGLQFRKAIGNPFDLERRALLLSINTLTIRVDRRSASVILHSRDAESVATSGGVIGVMPAGVFQPSTVRAGDHTPDFDLWRNIMREYSEEFLGNTEHQGDAAGADYQAEPFLSLDAARRAGQIRVYCLGVGISALDLWGAIETVAVIQADVFDEIFAGLVDVNDEGTVLTVGRHQPTVHVPFTGEVINELMATGRLAPETAFTLRAAWAHRDALLGPL